MKSQEKSSNEASSTGKGRPTRSRKEAEEARRRPLVPTDRKLAKKQSKEKRAEAYARQQEALETGDERYLPVRDKGRVRRYIRSYIDARWSIAELLLPAMVLFLGAMLIFSFVALPGVWSEYIIVGATLLFYGLLLASLIESLFVWRKLKRLLKEKYPNDAIARGTWFYMYSRMLMVRRWRSPKPQVDRGQYPR